VACKFYIGTLWTVEVSLPKSQHWHIQQLLQGDIYLKKTDKKNSYLINYWDGVLLCSPDWL
jgi:hypothetical protein